MEVRKMAKAAVAKEEMVVVVVAAAAALTVAYCSHGAIHR